QNTVIARHPIRQQVIDRRGLDGAVAAAEEELRAALPEEIGVRPVVHGDDAAGLVGAAHRVFVADVREIVTTRALEPESEEIARVGVSTAVRAAQRTV